MIDLNSLRSILQFSFPELQNLTTKDMEEMKWITKKKIFSTLLSESSSLREEFNELCIVEESREEELNQMAAKLKLSSKEFATKHREIRNELENSYRSKFLQVVVKALTRLQWPPTLEAFSNPLNDLFDDNEVIHSAIKYLLEIGTSKVCRAPKEPRSSNIMKRPASTPSPTKSIPQIPSKDISIISDIRRINESLDNQSFLTETNQYENTTPDNSHRYPTNLQSLYKSYELMQQQNESLAKQLNTLQHSTKTKHEMESRIENILSDILVALSNNSEDLNSTQLKVCEDNDIDNNIDNDKKIQSQIQRQSNKSIPKQSLKANVSQLTEMIKQWKRCRNEIHTSIINSMKIDERMDIEYMDTIKRPCDISKNRLFGVKKGLSSYSNDENSSQNQLFDIQRIHQLQQDLVKLATTCVETSNYWNENMKSTPFNHSVDIDRYLTDFNLQSQELLLHLSYLMPLAPKSVDKPYSSSTTGLELLSNELNSLKLSSKSLEAKFQQLLDRVKSEQQALVMSHESMKSCLKKWYEAARITNVIVQKENMRFKDLSNKILKSIEKTDFEVKSLAMAYKEADDARIPNDTIVLSSGAKGNKRQALVCPLDMLSRGCMGDKVANLINSLRIYFDGLDSTRNSFRDNFSKIQRDAEEEVEILQKFRHQLENATKVSFDSMKSL